MVDHIKISIQEYKIFFKLASDQLYIDDHTLNILDISLLYLDFFNSFSTMKWDIILKITTTKKLTRASLSCVHSIVIIVKKNLHSDDEIFINVFILMITNIQENKSNLSEFSLYKLLRFFYYKETNHNISRNNWIKLFKHASRKYLMVLLNWSLHF